MPTKLPRLPRAGLLASAASASQAVYTKGLVTRGLASRVSVELAAKNKEAARALPDSKGGEEPKSLQTARSEIFVYFTQPSSQAQLLFSAENWVRMKLCLQTAGPVAVGTRSSLTPVLSGRGILLDTDVEYEVYLAKGSRFYIASGTVNRVNVTIEPIPWLEQVALEINRVAAAVAGVAGSIVSGLTSILKSSSTPKAAAATAANNAAAEVSCPVPPRGVLPRLTRLPGTRKMP